MLTRVLAVTGAVVASLAVAAPAQAEPREPVHSQVITVRVATASSTSGVLEAWQWDSAAGEYARVLGPMSAFVGEDGVGRASERVSRTPAGTFSLTEAFGRYRDPGAHLPYRRVGLSDWWVSDVRSGKYNTYQRCSPGDRCGFDQSRSEQLGAIAVYGYAVVIDYNRAPIVKGDGSAFFLHVSEGRPTQGCVSVSAGQMKRIITWLRPADTPAISIGVGTNAYAELH